ncbi:hypothetical protein ACA910_002828 [Epithemia clementina (nom. ined.)]
MLQLLSTTRTCFFLWLLLILCATIDGFNIVYLAKRGGKGNLKRTLNDNVDGSNKKAGVKTANQGRGQEITGVTLPLEGEVRGWEFGEGVRLACVNVQGKYYAVQGQCPRCAFDLWKGDVIADDPAFNDLPRLACPTCSTTFGLSSGKKGPPLKRTGLQAFVGNLAKQATASDSDKDAKAFQITLDEEGRVFCREK